MDYYRNPRKYGSLTHPTVVHTESNPLCGDELEISMHIAHDTITEIRFRGKGCAISLASCSMICELIDGKPIDDAKRLTKDHVLTMLGIPITPVRLKCALLCLDLVQNALSKCQTKG